MKSYIPRQVITMVATVFSGRFSHGDLNRIFYQAGADWKISDDTKYRKIEDWLHDCNKVADNPLYFLGKILEPYLERDFEVEFFTDEKFIEDYNEEREKFRAHLVKYGIQYLKGGNVIPVSTSGPSFTLESSLEGKGYDSLKAEIERALTQVETDPAGALTAASASVESFCKIYLEENGLTLPKDQTIKPLWTEVSKSLGLDPARLEDNDLKKILGGLSSICDGIGALRTHAGSAHGRGLLAYKVEPRHARLAIFAAHTLVLFALETSEKRKKQVPQ